MVSWHTCFWADFNEKSSPGRSFMDPNGSFPAVTPTDSPSSGPAPFPIAGPSSGVTLLGFPALWVSSVASSLLTPWKARPLNFAQPHGFRVTVTRVPGVQCCVRGKNHDHGQPPRTGSCPSKREKVFTGSFSQNSSIRTRYGRSY